jgi:hypothetical protein
MNFDPRRVAFAVMLELPPIADAVKLPWHDTTNKFWWERPSILSPRSHRHASDTDRATYRIDKLAVIMEPMTDWHRMEWQYRANRCAVSIMLACVFLSAPEVDWALRYHFPWWDDVFGIITAIVFAVGWFVRRHTDMYRIDLY